MSLFQWGEFTSAAGKRLSFKIECDSLTSDDWECLAHLIAERVKFSAVEGVPRGGLELARRLEKFVTPDADMLLLVDDVFTTGGSMERQRAGRNAKGYVVFQRGGVRPLWIGALFVMTH